MNFQLGVWFAERPLSLGAAGEIFDRVLEGKPPELPASPFLKAFFNQLIARYPTLENWPDENVTECPWAEQPRFNPRYMIFTIMPAHAETLEAVIIDHATIHKLTVYDPQTPDLHLPPELEIETFWRLEADGIETVDPTVADIHRALEALKDDGESYLVLFESALAFMQVMLQGSEYQLEFVDKETMDPYCAYTPDRALAARVLADYRAENPAWRDALPWREID